MTDRQVLVVSNPDDEHTKVVCNKICELGGTPILFFPEEVGQRIKLVLENVASNALMEKRLLFSWGAVDLSRMFSVWYRRPRASSLISFGLDNAGMEFARDEWRAALEGMYALMDQSIWVSHPDRLRIAAQKPLQMKLAQELGLVTPHTLITNSPLEVSRFFEECKGRVVVKPTGVGWIYAENEKDVTYVLTNRIGHSDLNELSDIEIAPITIQEEVPKAYEIRANVVGQQICAIKIDSQKSIVSSLDWRRYDVEHTPYTPYSLPTNVAHRCLALVNGLGLQFGAIDLIRRPDGEYVFLEVNGNGQFLWAEELSGVEVSLALARLLTGNTPPLQPPDLQGKENKPRGSDHQGAVSVPIQRE